MVAPRGTGQLVRSLVRIPGSGSDRLADPVSLDLSNVSALAATVPISQRLPRNLFRSNSSLSTGAVEQHNYEDRLTNAAAKPMPKETTPAEEKTKEEVVSAGEKKRSLPEDLREVNESSSPPAPKVARVEFKFEVPAVSDSKESQNRIFVLPSASGTVIDIPVQQMNTAISPQQQQQQQSQVTNLSLSIVVSQPNQLETKAISPQIGSIVIGRPSPTATTTPYNVSAQLLQEVNKLRQEREALMGRLTKFQNIFKNKQTLQYIAKRLSESSAQA